MSILLLKRTKTMKTLSLMLLLSTMLGVVNAQSGFQRNSSCYSTQPTTVVYVPVQSTYSNTYSIPSYSNYQQGYQQGTQDYQQSHSKLLPTLPTLPVLPFMPAAPVYSMPVMDYNNGYQQGIINSYKKE
jgi:hypothetical protein